MFPLLNFNTNNLEMKINLLYKFFTLIFLSFFWTKIYSQSPGGITGNTVEYWLRADQVASSVPTDGADITTWHDLSGNNRNFAAPAAISHYPKFIKSAMNYHSAVNFYYLDAEDGGPSNADNQRRKLQTAGNFTVDPARSYFVIWVSRLDAENSSSYASVFSLNRSSATSSISDNSFGWRNNGALYHSTKGTAYTHNTLERTYGIGMAILPNNAVTAQQQYINALAKSTTTAARTLEITGRPSVLGNSNVGDGTSDYFYGEVMEVIVLSKSGTGSTLTTDELKKINSHLAIKYGITLNSSQTDYLLSDGTVIYNSASTGYTAYNKDIFGLARDDASGLNQKQSMSTENPSVTVYMGTLAETNLENTSVLTDKHAVMFGANGLTGNSSYSYNEGTAFQNYTLQTTTNPSTGVITNERISSIFNYKLRAKTTGQSSFTVNFKPGQGEYLLVSADPSFAPASTRLYKTTGGKVENVVVNDGDYVGFAYYLKAPGGVTNGLRMWLNASKQNTITLNSAGEVINWLDNAGFGTTYSQRLATGSNAGAPLFTQCDERTNFHPTPLFRKWQDALITNKAPFTVAAPNNSAVYAVVNHDLSSSDRSYIIGFGSTTAATNARRPAFGFYRGTGANSSKGYGRIGSTSLTNSSTFLFNSGATTIASYQWARGTNIGFDFDGYINTVVHTASTAVMNGPGMLGLGSSSNAYFLNGIMPEVIAYESILTQAEKNKINSYLGLKYGITIDLDKTSTTTNFDFLLSNGTSVWNGNNSLHQGYHTNVASIVRDDDAELYNRQSRSTDVGAIVHMGVGTKLGCSPVLGNITADKTALTWGHNGVVGTTLSLVGNPNVCGAMDSRYNGRIWLADNTNFTQEVMVSAYGSSFAYNGPGYQVYLLVADSPAKLAANNWDQIIPMTYADGKHSTSYKFTGKYTYFTFGAKAVAGNCLACAFEGRKVLDFSRTNWPTRGDKGPRTFNLGNNFNAVVTVVDPSNRLRNRYPRSSTQKTLRERRSNLEAVTTKVVFQDNGGAAVGAAGTFEIYDIDRTGSRRDDIQVIGYCNGVPVYPKLTYTYRRPERSRYLIGNNAKATAKARGIRYNGDSGYTSRRGRVLVEFETAVQEIDIVYTVLSTNISASTFIGIGPITFYCPKPLPTPNEDGLVFLKEGSSDVKLCDVVNYAFRIVNTNCAEKQVSFTDTLPAGMVWVNNSLSAGGLEISDANVTGYGTQTLSISNLPVAGGGTPLILRADAIFTSTAMAGVYQNQATLNYNRAGTQVSFASKDRYTGDAFTKTTAIASSRPQQIVTSISTDKSCFKLNDEIEVTLNISNPNAFSISDMFLGLDYDSTVFTLVANSIQTSSGLTLPANTGDAGSLEFDEFTLPSGNYWVKYKVLSSNNLSDYEINPTTLNPDDVNFAYDLSSESSDDCIASSTANANGEIDVPFCTFCTKPPVGGTAERSKVGITTLKQTLNGWPQNVPNGYLVLEAGKKGMVITRTTPAAIGSANWVKGMIIFDTSSDKKCISIYNGTEWKCIARSCNE